MEALVAVGKKTTLQLWMVISILVPGPIQTLAFRWGEYWITNHQRIMVLTAANTLLTTGSEIISRSTLSYRSDTSTTSGFLVQDARGKTIINKQSMINIIMTFFASLLGGPVYFMRSGWARFVFFVSFGFINSLISQSLLIMVYTDMIVSARRLAFDFAYNGTAKYLLFEAFRSKLIKPLQRKRKTFALRAQQDLVSATVKNALLNYLGFRGV